MLEYEQRDARLMSCDTVYTLVQRIQNALSDFCYTCARGRKSRCRVGRQEDNRRKRAVGLLGIINCCLE